MCYFPLQFLSETPMDFSAVHTTDFIPAVAVLVPLYIDVYEVDDVQHYSQR